ncbi:hypothetical protein HID58_066282 [Brassica napus]|uniref:(rape) hypothetical protein n=1 Tax=Brassica napus TaxID=3708 RepID=A0A816L1H6_BRANA|nr:cell wall protein DAN4-like [Brassica napus]KAH0878888.1 hypothetical protein HID58_066282 [Brassica napus]CAF1928863.1 unnamed protein product [Brassica napus]
MARVHLLLCFTLLFASVTLFDAASAFVKLKPSLPQIEDPKTVDDVEGYTVQVVMVFVGDLEKECPKTSKFKMFFDKLRGFAKYVCPLKIFGKKDDADMKAKEAGILKTIASFAIGRIKREIQEEKQEAIETFKFMKSLAGRILGGRKKEEKATTTLTPEQLKEIKDGILKWQTVIVKITNTMVVSTTNSEGSAGSNPGVGIPSTDTDNQSQGTPSADTNNESQGTTGGSSSPNSGSATGSPSNKPSAGSNPGAGTPSTDTNNQSQGTPSADTNNESQGTTGSSSSPNSGSATGSPSNKPSAGSNPGAGTPSTDTNNQSQGTTNTASSGSATTSQTTEVTVTEVETQTSEQVMTFLMNLEKKCPPKEEYKQFFEKLKSTMTGSAKVSSPKKKGGLFGMIKGAVGKIGDAMQFIRSRIGNKSAEVKKSMETYQAEVIKNMEELNAIYAKIVSQNQSKKGGAMTCTPEQQAEIKTTITKWEQVTTQFVEVAIKSETSTTTSTSTSASTGTAQAN